ncbi:uncharacterized protein LOC135088892 [Scylla paramamosain]|uniref:uncharacterized protein LOC135088892 n=1 Tax=Scylla paramamosain TaxID=85552 RepID=UPI003082EFAB
MLSPCVALIIFATAVGGQWSIPLRHNLLPALSPSHLKLSSFRPLYEAKPKRTSSTGAGAVVWLANCSPRQAFVSRKQDAQLQCEAVVPVGTEVTWYKNYLPLLRPGEEQENPRTQQIQQEVYEEITNEVSLPLAAPAPVAPSGSSSGTRLRVSPVVFIDCAAEKDEGEYSLEMRTPSNNVYFRNFTVRLLGMREEGSTCNMQTSQLESLPRIYYHSSWVWAVAGDSLTLPCRAQGRNLMHTWYVDNTYVGNTNPNYQVLANGDLIIRTVGMHSPTNSRCQVSSSDGPGSMDAVTTTIRIRSP